MKKKTKAFFRKIKKKMRVPKTLNVALIVTAAFFVWFNFEMLEIYRELGSLPETYACAVVAATIGEAGICGWIRIQKEKAQERKWSKEDRGENHES